MTLWQAIILGIVQGLTEFIPVSSTAHLIFASRALDLFSQVTDQTLRAEQTTASIAVLQLGTLVAVLIYFARDIWNILVAFVRDHFALLRGTRRDNWRDAKHKGWRNVESESRFGLSQDAWLGWLIIIGSIPVGVVGLLFKKQIEGTFTKNLWVISTMMVVVAVILAVAERVGQRKRDMEQLRLGDAVVVGCSQCLALIPGASRSGSTIMGGLFSGLTRETAARFSFLLSIPAVGASGLLELKEALHSLPPDSGVPLFVGTIIAGIIGYASIWGLLRYLRTHSTFVFIGYRLILGVILLALLFAGIISPLTPLRTKEKKASVTKQIETDGKLITVSSVTTKARR
ncbi:MAG: undecaprenyl-diphosphate phosphatase [Pyrinomonadaceae bacterium]